MRFDYTNQAWTSDGVYMDCGHYEAGTILGPGGLNSGKVFRGAIATAGLTQVSRYLRRSLRRWMSASGL